jgi:hypothetical protein
MTYPYKSDFEDDVEYTYGEAGLASVMDKNKGQYKYKIQKNAYFHQIELENTVQKSSPYVITLF